MANGDLANSSGLFTSVSSGADFRQGYDDINRLADAAAGVAGLGLWTMAPIALATGFTGLVDAAGNPSTTPQASLVGGVRKQGGMLAISFRCTSTNAFTAVSGDISDTTVATIATGYRPSGPRQFMFSQKVGGVARLGSDGVLAITAYDSNASWTAGSLLVFDGLIPL